MKNKNSHKLRLQKDECCILKTLKEMLGLILLLIKLFEMIYQFLT
jgi:hypothetical protein